MKTKSKSTDTKAFNIGGVISQITYRLKKKPKQGASIPVLSDVVVTHEEVESGSTLGRKPQNLPIIGGMSQGAQVGVVIGAGAILLAISAAVGISTDALSKRVENIQTQVSTTVLLSQGLRSDMEAAANGTIPSFRQADLNKREIRRVMAELGTQTALPPGVAAGLPPAQVTAKWDDPLWSAFGPGIMSGDFSITAPLQALWDLHSQADLIGLYEPTMLSFADALSRAKESGADMVVGASSNGRIASRLIGPTTAARDSIAAMLQGGGDKRTIDLAVASINGVRTAISTLSEAERADPSVIKMVADTDSALASVGRVIAQNYVVTAPLLQETMAGLTDAAEKYTQQANAFVYAGSPGLVVTGWIVTIVLAVLALLSLMMLAVISGRAAAMSSYAARFEQKETDDAIFQIMNELRPISSGDLVQRLTVTEHVTGTVADRINMMTESTQEALQEVKGATREAESSMEDIFELSEEAKETAETATQQAQSSRLNSVEGAAAVGRAVDKMNDARNSIQEVSKRVKNLGEVAQSIASITEVIEQMAEKTKVLALNTSLIASEAGEGGAKYRTLAKEIDKMSDDTKKSLTEISASVKSMQAETQMVISTVEGVTSDVVASSKLWDEALSALDKITESSNEIEALVASLQGTTNKQAVSASKAVVVMGRLSESAQKFRTNKEDEVAA